MAQVTYSNQKQQLNKTKFSFKNGKVRTYSNQKQQLNKTFNAFGN